MNRSRILQPLRQTLARPVVQQSRSAFVGTAARSHASQADPEPKLAAEAQPTAEATPAAEPKPATGPKHDVPKDDGLTVPFPMRHELHPDEKRIRLPRSVQALYLQPLRREAEYGVPSCDLQLRSYSIPNLEFFCDFALRAAYYLNLPAFGPVPLPKITERWTVPKSHFIFKKSQENFERITRRRLIQIRDGHPETVQIWLAFLQKHAYYGIGMKANIWEYSKLDVGAELESDIKALEGLVEEKMKLLGRDQTLGTVQKVQELLESQRFNTVGGQRPPP